MRRSLLVLTLALLMSACSAAPNAVVEPPIEQGKDPACVKKCQAKQKECVAGAKTASMSVVAERCYDGYEICVKACRPK